MPDHRACSQGEVERWAHQVLVAATAGTVGPPDWLRHRLDRGLGGVCLFGRNIVDAEQLRGFTDGLRESRPDILVSIDEEGGDVTRLHRTEGSPHLGHLALGALRSPTTTAATATAIGTELAAAGIDWDLAPVADVNADPDSPVIGVRSFGDDPIEVARQVTAYVSGLAAAGIAGCAKHFPGHGATAADSHTDLPRITIDRAELDAVHLPPFTAAVEAGVETVMLGHLLVTSVDPDLPASLSPAAVRLLREDLGFDGVVVTDALEMRAVTARRSLPEAAVLAIIAGADALCLSGGLHDEDVVAAVVDALVRAVHDGRLVASRLAEAATRMESFAAARARARFAAAHPPVTAPPPLPPMPGPADRAIPDPVLARSLRVRGDPRVGTGPIAVVTHQPPPNVAAGRVPWDPAVALAARRPGSTVYRVAESDDAAAPAMGAAADAETGTGAAAGAEAEAAVGAEAVAAAGAAVGAEAGVAVGAEAGVPVGFGLMPPYEVGRPVLVTVRDLHRHPRVRAALRVLLSVRPDTVVVELGVPVLDPGGRAWICSHGAGAASVAAVDAVLRSG